MVDAGWYTPEVFSSLQTGLKDLGLTLADISTVVFTHVHPDHFGLAGKIKQVSPKTQLLCHQWEADLIEARYIKFAELRSKLLTLLKRHGVPSLELSALESSMLPPGFVTMVTVAYPDRILYGGEILSTGIYDIEVIWTPGHSPGHICLYEPQHRLLFSGDHILPSITPNVSYHVHSGDNPLGDYTYALHKLQNLPVATVLPAHENIFSDLRGRIEQIFDHHAKRKTEIKATIANSPHNAWEISSRITWNVSGLSWDKLPPLLKRSALTETIAHLECMRWEGTVQRIIEGDSIAYVAR